MVHYVQKRWVTNFPTLKPPLNRGQKANKLEIFNLVGNGHLSNPMNRLNENITYLVSFFLFFINSMRTFLFDHTVPEKYPRNITPYKMITRSTIKTQSANCPKLATEFEKKKMLSPT